MDLATREVRRGGRAIELTRTEFTLLEMFLRRPRRVLERSFILEEVWGYDFPTTANSLEVYVGYLRRKTEAEGEPRLIHTVRGVGYVLQAPAPGDPGAASSDAVGLALPAVAGQPGHPADHDRRRRSRSRWSRSAAYVTVRMSAAQLARRLAAATAPTPPRPTRPASLRLTRPADPVLGAGRRRRPRSATSTRQRQRRTTDRHR